MILIISARRLHFGDHCSTGEFIRPMTGSRRADYWRRGTRYQTREVCRSFPACHTIPKFTVGYAIGPVFGLCRLSLLPDVKRLSAFSHYRSILVSCGDFIPARCGPCVGIEPYPEPNVNPLQQTLFRGTGMGVDCLWPVPYDRSASSNQSGNFSSLLP